MRAGDELAALGVSARRATAVVAHIRQEADRVAQEFVKLFLESVWKPFEREGRPEDRWPEVRDALERLRPLAADSLLAVFQLAMNDAVEEAFGRELRRLGRDAKRHGSERRRSGSRRAR
jgi:hypothetical protein